MIDKYLVAIPLGENAYHAVNLAILRASRRPADMAGVPDVSRDIPIL